jgi:acyl-ACP thioesterase
VTDHPAPDHAEEELIAVPVDGRVFGLDFRAGLGDCAPSGRIRLDALARWLQDVAYGDVDDAGLADAAVWVLRRTRIQVHRWPRFGERMRVRTFCSGIGRMWAERRTTIAAVGTEPGADGSPGDIETVALWVHLDPETRMPSVLTDQEIETYGGTGAGRRVRSRLRHPKPDQVERAGTWLFRAADMDIADHINNAAYWAPVEEELATLPEPARLDAEIEFRSPAQPGVKRLLSNGPLLGGGRRWIAGERPDELHASIFVRSSNGPASTIG